MYFIWEPCNQINLCDLYYKSAMPIIYLSTYEVHHEPSLCELARQKPGGSAFESNAGTLVQHRIWARCGLYKFSCPAQEGQQHETFE